MISHSYECDPFIRIHYNFATKYLIIFNKLQFIIVNYLCFLSGSDFRLYSAKVPLLSIFKS